MGKARGHEENFILNEYFYVFYVNNIRAKHCLQNLDTPS